MSNVNFTTDTSSLSAKMNFQEVLDAMQTAVADANKKLVEAQKEMKAGDPSSVINVQIAMASFTQIFTSLTNVLNSLKGVTDSANRNIS
jgi:flagellar hook-basal body complex protein FliE